MVVASANQQPGADELDDVGRSLALSLLGEADGSGLRARRRAARAAQREAVSAPAEPDVAPTDAAPVRRRRVVTTGATPPTAPTPWLDASAVAMNGATAAPRMDAMLYEMPEPVYRMFVANSSGSTALIGPKVRPINVIPTIRNQSMRV